MNQVTIKSPTRVDLAGGTLDMWPLCAFLIETYTVNVAIDIYSEAKILPREDSQIIIDSKDLSFRKVYANIESVLNAKDPQLLFYKPILRHFYQQGNLRSLQGFELQTQSQSPVGGGLGGSSSLLISVLKAFHVYLGVPATDSHKMVYLAHNLEAQMLMTPTGTQDYYPAFSGGLNILKYSPTGIEQKIISVTNSVLKDHFLLVYTGKSHHSGINNFEVLKSAVAQDKTTLNALEELNRIAFETKLACEQGRWQDIPTLFNEEFKYRVQLTSAFSSEEINRLREISITNGAQAVKICGAGGGGCVLIWVSPSERNKVVVACEKEGFKVLNSVPVDL